MANHVDYPIEFDADFNEYNFVYPESAGQATLRILHCPWCGGTAPRSKRSQLFHSISREEEERLLDILDPLETIEAAKVALGEPGSSGRTTSRKPEAADAPPKTTYHRVVTYYDLSDVANVCGTIIPDGTLRWSLQGKQIINQNDNEANDAR